VSRRQFPPGSLADVGAIAGAATGTATGGVTFAGPFRQVCNQVQEYRFDHGGACTTTCHAGLHHHRD
jgi:hypothetical protein